MYCSHCGAANDVDSRFCLKCGQPLTDSPQLGQETAPAKRRAWWLAVLAVVLTVAAGACALDVLRQAACAPSIPAATATRAPASSRTTLAPVAQQSTPAITVDAVRLRGLTAGLSSPAARQVITDTVTSSELQGALSRYDGRTITMVGKVVSRQILSNTAPISWRGSSLLMLDVGDGIIPIVYAGNTSELDVGDDVQVVGAISAAGAGVNADVVVKTDPLTAIASDVRSLVAAEVLGILSSLAFLLFSLQWAFGRRGRTSRVSKEER